MLLCFHCQTPSMVKRMFWPQDSCAMYECPCGASVIRHAEIAQRPEQPRPADPGPSPPGLRPAKISRGRNA